jgi:hypothetical protein
MNNLYKYSFHNKFIHKSKSLMKKECKSNNIWTRGTIFRVQENETWCGSRKLKTLGGSRKLKTPGGSRKMKTLGGSRKMKTLGVSRKIHETLPPRQILYTCLLWLQRLKINLWRCVCDCYYIILKYCAHVNTG